MNALKFPMAVPLGVLLYLISSSVYAGPPPVVVPPPAPVSLISILQVLLSLAVVLGVVAGAAWLLRRFAPGQVSAGGAIKVIGGIAVGTKERVVVVEVGETWLVVGVAPGQVTALHSMPKVVNSPESDTVDAQDPSFSLWLRDVMKRRSTAAGDK